jgi:inner membrane protein
MSPVTHFLLGWTVASTNTSLSTRERAAVTLAGVVPDIDGVGIVWDLVSRSGSFDFYQRYHHVFGHNLFFGLLVAACGLLLGVRKWLIAALMFVSFHLHLLGDILGARGEKDDFWAVPYFWPFSARDYYWTGQWPLNGWQNVLITVALLALMFYLTAKRGYSPVEMVSSRADQEFVRTLRNRFSFLN